MNEFSPAIVGDLGPLLDVVKANEGNKDALANAIFQESNMHVAANSQHLNRANNVVIGMSECGLVDLGTRKLTAFGEELQKAKDDGVRYRRLAQHILKKCFGEDLLDVVRSLNKRGEEVKGPTIRSELRARGFKVTTNAGDAFKIRKWLEKAGVINEDWEIDESVFEMVSGISSATKNEWMALSRSQQAFLSTLRELYLITKPDWFEGGHVKKLCQARWGQGALPEGALRAQVLDPLEAEGWIETRGKGGGRGGKIGEVRATKKLLDIKSAPDVGSKHSGIPKDLLAKLDTPMEQVYNDLNSSSKYKKGLALELLSMRLCRSVGLRPVEMRKRGTRTQGAEVDVICDGLQLHYSRWMFQCKNTPKSAVDVEDLAKEVGLAVLLKANVIVMVTTGKFTRVVRQHANGIATETALQVVLIDGKMLQKIRAAGEGALVEMFVRQAENALKLKSIQVKEELVREDAD